MDTATASKKIDKFQYHDYYLMDPLAYHNAILFERLGYNYVQGLRKMQWIHLGFQPGGILHNALDGSTPFRQPDA